jgi:hypothetical protein
MSNRHLNQSITTRQYTDAVTSLVKWAQKDCGGSRVCAQVLLSAYNGVAFQLNIVDLGLLDEQLLADAMAVILGRTVLNMEPHILIDDGDKIFDALWRQWQGYHVKERGIWTGG